MTTINTAEDLIEVLKRDGKVRSAVRREILTEELLGLPARVGVMLETQTEMLAQITALREDFGSMQKTQTEMQRTQTSILKNIEGLHEEQISLRKTHEADRKESIQDMHRFRGNYAVDAAVRNMAEIAKPFARLRGMRQIRCEPVGPGELRELLARLEDEQALLEFTDDDLNNFAQIDLVFGVMGRTEQEPVFYIAVEASYTGHSGDVARAVVRSKILAAVTGKVTYAVVASVHLNPAISDRITVDAEGSLASPGANNTFWYKIVEEDMEPPSPR